MSFQDPYPCHCTGNTFFQRNCRSHGEPLATLLPLQPDQDLNLRPPAPETNALRLDRLACFENTINHYLLFFARTRGFFLLKI